MNMNLNISLCCLSLLLLLNLIGAKPVSNLQLMRDRGDRKRIKNMIVVREELYDSESFKQLFEEDINTAPYSSEEMDAEGKDGNAEFLFAAPERHQWDSSDTSNWSLATKQNVISRLLKDIMRTSKRSWSRYKKGGLRSCFGVRLERIGSFSGLGC